MPEHNLKPAIDGMVSEPEGLDFASAVALGNRISALKGLALDCAAHASKVRRLREAKHFRWIAADAMRALWMLHRSLPTGLPNDSSQPSSKEPG